MARTHHRPAPLLQQVLTASQHCCWGCGTTLWVAYHKARTVITLDGLCRLTLVVRRCRNRDCSLYHRLYRPEEEGRWALPHGEFGLDVIALVGTLRYISHRSIPEIHQALCDRGVPIAERTVTHLLQRYEELVTLSLSDQQRLRERFKEQGQIIALDGLQPDVGHEVLWVCRFLSAFFFWTRALSDRSHTMAYLAQRTEPSSRSMAHAIPLPSIARKVPCDS